MWKFCTAAFALTFSVSSLAQQLPPPTNQQDIVVVGNKNADTQMREFIRTVTVTERNFGQLGRFESPACPYVVGLGQSQDQMVAARMRQVADAVGIETGAKRCNPNVFVFVVDDKKSTINWIERHAARLLVDANGHHIPIPNDDSPATGWHVRGMKDDFGRESDVYVIASMATRIRPMARPHFLASVLVVEARSLAGLTTTELADYAAMRAFAQLDPKKLKPSTVPTILNILDAPMGTAIPLTLTDWDLAFLHGLYASALNQYAATQRVEIQRSMRKELAERRDRSTADSNDDRSR